MSKDKYTVFGNPIAHSKSPVIHARFAEQTGEPIEYDKTCVEDNNFARAIRELESRGGKGANVTVPFKEDAFNFCTELSEAAEKAGAVNTVSILGEGQYRGDNTDGVGLVTDITLNLAWPIEGKRVLVVGAGGAVRGVLGPLLQQNPSELVVANRTEQKARSLENLFANDGNIRASGFDALEGVFDLVINGTSASLGGELPPVPAAVISADTAVYDMMYSQEETVFNRWAREQGASRTSDGLGMLVEQAAEAFRIWRGVRPDTSVVIYELRKA